MALTRTQKRWAIGGGVGAAGLLGFLYLRKHPFVLGGGREHEHEHEHHKHHEEHDENDRGEYGEKKHHHHGGHHGE